MLSHLSLAANDPRHVAKVFAEIIGGEAQSFAFVGQGSWVALSGDERGTMIEIYSRGIDQSSGADARTAAPRFTPTHLAVATPKSREAVLAIGDREGWPVKLSRRGDMFDAIELWVEGCQLIEVLTGEAQADCIQAVRVENWRAMVLDFELRQLAHAA